MTSEAGWVQITALNEMVKIRLAPSEIHGIGVFAIRDIKKGERLYADHTPTVYTLRYADFGKLNKEVKQIILERWPQVVSGASYFAFPDARYMAYMNHANPANYDAFNDIVLEEIRAGEEVTEDYMLIPGWQTAHPWLAPQKDML